MQPQQLQLQLHLWAVAGTYSGSSRCTRTAQAAGSLWQVPDQADPSWSMSAAMLAGLQSMQQQLGLVWRPLRVSAAGIMSDMAWGVAK